MTNANGKYTLEELLNKPDWEELKDLKKTLQRYRNEKKNHNFVQLKTISETLELIVTLLEKQTSKQKELEEKFRSVKPE